MFVVCKTTNIISNKEQFFMKKYSSLTLRGCLAISF